MNARRKWEWFDWMLAERCSPPTTTTGEDDGGQYEAVNHVTSQRLDRCVQSKLLILHGIELTSVETVFRLVHIISSSSGLELEKVLLSPSAAGNRTFEASGSQISQSSSSCVCYHLFRPNNVSCGEHSEPQHVQRRTNRAFVVHWAPSSVLWVLGRRRAA